MFRLILIVLVLFLTLLGVIAIGLFKFYGWKGMIAFPFIVVALLWFGKYVIGKLVKRFALGLFSMKSGALRGATIQVHSVTAIPEPADTEPDESDEEEDDAVDEDDPQDVEEDDEEEEEEPKQYFAVDVTIKPQPDAKGRVWEPSEFVLVSKPIRNIEDLEDSEVGSTHDVQIWDGTKFGPDDPGKYEGAQRLNLTVALVPGTSVAWLQYYDQTLGLLDFPKWDPKIQSLTA